VARISGVARRKCAKESENGQSKRKSKLGKRKNGEWTWEADCGSEARWIECQEGGEQA
jgi:hypothetical protein